MSSYFLSCWYMCNRYFFLWSGCYHFVILGIENRLKYHDWQLSGWLSGLDCCSASHLLLPGPGSQCHYQCKRPYRCASFSQMVTPHPPFSCQCLRPTPEFKTFICWHKKQFSFTSTQKTKKCHCKHVNRHKHMLTSAQPWIENEVVDPSRCIYCNI